MENKNEYQPSYDWLNGVRDGIRLFMAHIEKKVPADIFGDLSTEALEIEAYVGEKILAEFSKVRLMDFSK